MVVIDNVQSDFRTQAVKERIPAADGANIAVFIVIIGWRFAPVEELNNAARVSLHVDKPALAQGITS